MPIPDDVKRQALLGAQSARETLKETSLPQGVEAGTNDHRDGPTTLPGQTPGYGQNYNPVEAAQPAPAPEPTPEPVPTPEPG